MAAAILTAEPTKKKLKEVFTVKIDDKEVAIAVELVHAWKRCYVRTTCGMTKSRL
jgi:hypothetical protein